MKFTSLTLLIIVLLTTFVSLVNSARILAISPLPYFSHQYFFRPVWKELAQRGHQVVLITSNPMPGKIPNLEQKDISSALKAIPQLQVKYSSFISASINHHKWMLAVAEANFASEPLQNLIQNKSEQFDLVIAECYSPEMFSLKKLFNTPLIIHSPMDVPNMWYQATGSPKHELLYSFFRVIPKDPGLLERVQQLFSSLLDFGFQWHFLQIEAVCRKYFGEHALTLYEAQEQVDLFLINTNYVLHEMRPVVPSIVQLGGGMFLHAEQETMPQDLQNILDKSIEGVIYFSLGTIININSMSEKSLAEIVNTFPLLPYKVIWKTEELPLKILKVANQSGNVFISKWLPQPKVLMHKNVKLFITQGGVQSLEEAIILKKPTIVIPFFADQHSNAHRIECLHLGAQLNINTITTSLLFNTIINVLLDRKIIKNLEKHSNNLLDQPMNPLDRAVWWVEYVIRHKGSRHLHAKALPWWQEIYADVIVFLLAIIAFSILITVVIIVKIIKKRSPKVKQN